MATRTDTELRTALDSNQRDRERMCLAILALDRRYTEVRPRHPLGGRDGGRDIEAVLDGDRIVYAAVGFINGATESKEHKKQIVKKFTDDLASALEAKSDLKAFVFFTNVMLTVGERDALRARATKKGVDHCDVVDRERLRNELDSPRGYFIRFQYVGIALSPEEQASFLSQYGDQVQDMVGSGFQRMERKLDRVLFLQEAAETLESVVVVLRLKEPYSAAAIGHFRAFVSLSLRSFEHGLVRLLFGATDKSARFDDQPAHHANGMRAGIAHGIAYGQWERRLDANDLDDENDGQVTKFSPAGGGSSIGLDPVPAIVVRYTHADPMFHINARMQLRDLDGCMFLPLVNGSLADKVEGFSVFADSYKLLEIDSEDFWIDRSTFQNDMPAPFSSDELADGWVRLRPRKASMFRLRFDQKTPRRTFAAEEIRDAAPPDPK